MITIQDPALIAKQKLDDVTVFLFCAHNGEYASEDQRTRDILEYGERWRKAAEAFAMATPTTMDGICCKINSAFAGRVYPGGRN